VVFPTAHLKVKIARGKDVAALLPTAPAEGRFLLLFLVPRLHDEFVLIVGGVTVSALAESHHPSLTFSHLLSRQM
jgi:hypothetical protein